MNATALHHAAAADLGAIFRIAKDQILVGLTNLHAVQHPAVVQLDDQLLRNPLQVVLIGVRAEPGRDGVGDRQLTVAETGEGYVLGDVGSRLP